MGLYNEVMLKRGGLAQGWSLEGPLFPLGRNHIAWP